MADAQHLPQGRHQAGDRHLKFHETRDNLVLGVPPGLDQARLREAYRRAVAVAGPGSGRERSLREAYAVLGDPRLRAEYDRGRVVGVGYGKYAQRGQVFGPFPRWDRRRRAVSARGVSPVAGTRPWAWFLLGVLVALAVLASAAQLGWWPSVGSGDVLGGF